MPQVGPVTEWMAGPIRGGEMPGRPTPAPRAPAGTRSSGTATGRVASPAMPEPPPGRAQDEGNEHGHQHPDDVAVRGDGLVGRERQQVHPVAKEPDGQPDGGVQERRAGGVAPDSVVPPIDPQGHDDADGRQDVEGRPERPGEQSVEDVVRGVQAGVDQQQGRG